MARGVRLAVTVADKATVSIRLAICVVVGGGVLYD